MTTTRRAPALLTVSLLALVLSGLSLGARSPLAVEPLPARLTNQEFWRLSQTFSEPDGTFHSENLVSNEARFQSIVPALVAAVQKGRAYVGVGSEQNFTYITAVRPTVVFLVDIRRGNLDLHLIYKTLFELSADRADFVSRLFSRPRPDGLTTASTADQIFTAYANVTPSETLYTANLRAIERHLMTTHGFQLLPGDHEGIAFVYCSWFEGGPDPRYQLTTGGGGGFRGGRGGGVGSPTYADLMTATDDKGVNHSYLATEASFQFLKNLETRNMLVPVVGNFGGPRALRAVAAWLRQHEQTVGAFYTSNVEQYLRQDGIWSNFCASVATLPIDRSSTLIRSERGGFAGSTRGGGGFWLSLEPIESTTGACAVR